MKLYHWHFGDQTGICFSTDAEMKRKSQEYAKWARADGVAFSDIMACYGEVFTKSPPTMPAKRLNK